MLMSGEEIRSAGVIGDPADGMYKAASYNVRIGRIILPEGEEAEHYRLPPLGMVKVISLERLYLPRNMLAYATVKTGLSNDGILAINIGLVDPDYGGFVSSILINFSKNDYRLQRGDEFLRLTFHRYRSPDGPVPRPSNMMAEAEYVREAKGSFVQKFSPTFLNIEENTRQFLRRELGATILRWLPLAAFIVAGFTFLLNFGNAAVSSYFAQKSFVQQSQSQIQKDIEQLKKQSTNDVEQLRSRIVDVEKQLQGIEDSLTKEEKGNASTARKKRP